MRRLHQFAVGVHLAGLAGWSCFYGALSLMALRKAGIRA